MNTKNVQNQLEARIVKRNHCGATNQQRIQNALEYFTFVIPDTTGVVEEKRFEINF